MREFMHYITNAFYDATGWNEDNSYKELNATARGRPFLTHHRRSHGPQSNSNSQSSSTSPSPAASA